MAFVGVLAFAVGLIGAAGARAAPARAPVVFGPPAEGAKVTLGETSVDGPALTATYAPATALAWTGTDPAHHLNLLTSQDGLHYANKHILPETSLWRPAIAFIDSGRGAPYGTIVLAWTGTDPAHTLNLEFLATPDLSVTRKITYWGETSYTAPDVATVNGDVNSDVYLAWAGTDPAHTVNVLHHTTVPGPETKQTLWGESSISRPNIAHDQSPNASAALILSWTAPDNHIHFLTAVTSQGAPNWSKPTSSPLGQQSAWAPSMVGFYATNMPSRWLACTGSGSRATREINVQYTERFPDWTNVGSALALDETAISGPELAYSGGGGQVLLAWTGTDAAQHLNVAVVSVPAGSAAPTPTAVGYAVKVYFSKHPDSDTSFGAVFPVARVSPSLGVGTYAIQQLIAGPTSAEAASGLFTELTAGISGASNCGAADFQYAIDQASHTGTLRFCKTVLLPGDASGPRIKAEIAATLTQFPNVTKVVILDRTGHCFDDLSGTDACLRA